MPAEKLGQREQAETSAVHTCSVQRPIGTEFVSELGGIGFPRFLEGYKKGNEGGRRGTYKFYGDGGA